MKKEKKIKKLVEKYHGTEWGRKLYKTRKKTKSIEVYVKPVDRIGFFMTHIWRGKRVKRRVFKSVSKFFREMYCELQRKVKDGDTIYIIGGNTAKYTATSLTAAMKSYWDGTGVKDKNRCSIIYVQAEKPGKIFNKKFESFYLQGVRRYENV